eukprot:350035-Alexandrium_andersonii.AAC.1
MVARHSCWPCNHGHSRMPRGCTSLESPARCAKPIRRPPPSRDSRPASARLARSTSTATPPPSSA